MTFEITPGLLLALVCFGMKAQPGDGCVYWDPHAGSRRWRAYLPFSGEDEVEWNYTSQLEDAFDQAAARYVTQLRTLGLLRVEKCRARHRSEIYDAVATDAAFELVHRLGFDAHFTLLALPG